MAIIDKYGNKRGREGNTIYRVLGGIQISQSAPKPYTQSAATRRSSIEFGFCSHTATTLRNVFLELFGWADKQMGSRLVAVVKNAIFASSSAMINERDLHDGDWSYFNNFQLNRHSPLNQFLKVTPQTSISEDGKISVYIPGINKKRDVLFPHSSLRVYCKLQVTLLALNFRGNYYQALAQKEAEIGNETEVIHWSFDESIEGGTAVLVFLSLHYFAQDDMRGQRYLNGENLNPVGIIGAYQFWEGRKPDNEPSEPLPRLALPGYRGHPYLSNP